jgi:cytochrome c-type biogenesis protein
MAQKMSRELETATMSAPISSARRLTTFAHAVLFVFGFSLVFVLGWGGTTTVVGQLFSQYKSELAKIGGVMVIVFGLANLGLLKIPWLYYDTRPQWDAKRRTGWASSTLMGVFFAAGWTPCIGTTLGAILTLGFSQETSGQAMWLSSGYALGLGIPFLIIGLGIDRAARFVRRFRRYIRTVQIASGLLLIVIGLMLLTNQMAWIAIWAQRNGLYLDLPLGGTSAPTYLVALLAGLISFLSPCVLPLVPAYVGYLSGRVVGEM